MEVLYTYERALLDKARTPLFLLNKQNIYVEEISPLLCLSLIFPILLYYYILSYILLLIHLYYICYHLFTENIIFIYSISRKCIKSVLPHMMSNLVHFNQF